MPDAHALNTWLVSLKKPLRKVKELIRKTGGRRVLAHGTSMMTKTFGDPERVEGSENKSCGHKDILRAILLRDPLGLGLEVFGADGKKIAQLIGALLKWSPAERISAAEAAALPMFGDIVPA